MPLPGSKPARLNGILMQPLSCRNKQKRDLNKLKCCFAAPISYHLLPYSFFTHLSSFPYANACVNHLTFKSTLLLIIGSPFSLKAPALFPPSVYWSCHSITGPCVSALPTISPMALLKSCECNLGTAQRCFCAFADAPSAVCRRTDASNSRKIRKT